MRASPLQSDEELWRLMRAGDERAFTALYQRRQGGVYRFALQMSGSEEIAADVTQEVFLALMRTDEPRYDQTRGSLASYLYGIARHQVLRRLEKERAFVAIADDAADDNSSDFEGLKSTHDPLEELTRGELIASVRRAVLALPPHYREVVVLCELHEMSYAEAACVLGCAVGTVRSRLHRARELLIEKLRALRETQSEAAPPQTNTTRCFA